ncbi:23675_t:CDS:2 [Dentiscutata erythropus]|uniref:GPI-anchored wall transfer protein n=1 Tax=Dentiscutata erythropus TaxID=1348616 RepID=A0A9N8VDB3_9GLOM|nr:23675_t:CDS:2 [Dentiscutata erythropus]
MDEVEYKKAKEDWVTGHEGGSMWEIYSISFVLLNSFVLWSAAAKYTKIFDYASNNIISNFLLEYMFLIIPSLLSCTLLVDFAFYLNVILLILTFVIINTSSMKSTSDEKKKKKNRWESDSDEEEIIELSINEDKLDDKNLAGADSKSTEKINIDDIRRKPFLSAFRSSMMILTCLSILAVDFPIFPRRLAKTETYGTSLMDLGVGSFVFSSGIVAARPFLKKPENRFKPLRGQLLRAVRQALPILILGFIRLMMVKGVDYQEHASEYGVHWNFFFTLGFLPIFVTICRTLHKYIRFSILGLSIAILYQIVLNRLGLEDYILYAHRTDLISSNKEGICSFWGYLSVFLVALDIGHYILPVDPYYAIRQNRQNKKKPKPQKLAMILFSWVILLWLGFMLCIALRIPVSRRIANLSYVFWVIASNTTFLLLFQVAEITFLEEYWKNERNLPMIIEAVNSNGLAVFLLANLLTGLVNLSIRTLFVNDSLAGCILAGYMFIIVVIAVWFNINNWKFKL